MSRQQSRDKHKIIEQLHKLPIVQIACQRAGIPRSTYYRWRREDLAFATECNAALADGIGLINDLAESKVIAGINEGKTAFIIFWLNNRHSAYGRLKESIAEARERKQYEDLDRIIQQITNDLTYLPDDSPRKIEAEKLRELPERQ